VSVDLLIGAQLVASAASNARGADREALDELAMILGAEDRALGERVAAALDPELEVLMARHPDRRDATRYQELAVIVDRERARFSAWYELFPRSWGRGRAHGTFRDAERMLPYIARMGFDVVYLPPIHPIGRTNRKGRNNALRTQTGDPGSPWAVGAAEGGHTAIHPELGSEEDFAHFCRSAHMYGLETALDIAFQASPDHPWVKEHPQWFRTRPDGSIQHAENPPKKYEDIYPIDFDSADWKALWHALLEVFQFWIDRGVRIFRVDNPHTKSLQFWQWCIDAIQRRHPDAIFLAEAFTRPKLMYALAKAGFSQSYTYFTWRNSSWELREYMHELVHTPVAQFFRPNFWPNTPDILPEHLQHGGRPAFVARLVLATMLSSNYGIYGPAFELMDNVARSGSGEYLDNEKYEIKEWRVDDPRSLRPLIARLNRIRRAHPALQRNDGYAWHQVDNGALFCFSKRHEDDVILVAVNLDFYFRQGGFVELDMPALGLGWDASFLVHDLISDAEYTWHGPRNYIELDPFSMAAHVFHVRV
jgi:starch synthase (maltosyl-transferring)